MNDRVPLEYPLHGATFGESVRRFWKKWRVYAGRASRSEFWWAHLFTALIGAAISIPLTVVYTIVLLYGTVASVGDGTSIRAGTINAWVIITLLYAGALVVLYLPFLIPQIALIVRRLHDAGFSGLLALLLLAPGAVIAVIVLCALESAPDGARDDHTPNPSLATTPS